jgi:Trehalase
MQPHMKHVYERLSQQASAVLKRNWTGAFTKPGGLLYQHQWSWDSAFIAMGSVHVDQSHAEQELRTLFEGQWANGMLPHMIFNPQAANYQDRLEFWEIWRSALAPRQRQTSGIVQPPVHATAILHIYRHAQDRARARVFLAEMFPRLKAWHAYLYRQRDPQGEGLVSIQHPWESLDNSPIWDPILRRIQLRPEEVPAYRRVDIQSVNAQDRPGRMEYDRYAYLVKLFAERNYDEAQIRRDCPFLVQDVLFNALLCQANRDLAEIARLLDEDPTPCEAWAEQTAQATNQKLWDEEHGIYNDFDLVTDKLIHAPSVAGFLPLFAGISDAVRARRMYTYLNSDAFCSLAEACYAVPSYDRHEPEFSPHRYWRGPVWINMNWLLSHGMRRYGFQEYAQRLRQSIIDLAQKHGFYEYYDPFTGRGHGTDQFSWTAALLLDILHEEL